MLASWPPTLRRTILGSWPAAGIGVTLSNMTLTGARLDWSQSRPDCRMAQIQGAAHDRAAAQRMGRVIQQFGPLLIGLRKMWSFCCMGNALTAAWQHEPHTLPNPAVCCCTYQLDALTPVAFAMFTTCCWLRNLLAGAWADALANSAIAQIKTNEALINMSTEQRAPYMPQTHGTRPVVRRCCNWLQYVGLDLDVKLGTSCDHLRGAGLVE